MATDVLGRALTKYGGSFSIDDALLTFPNLSGKAAFVPSIITQLGLQYQQAISRFYGINRNQVYLVAGRTAGNATLQQILSPDGRLATFYSVYGNVCKAKSNILQFSLNTGCDSDQIVKTILKAGMCVVQQLAFSNDAETATVGNNFAMSYESLEYSEN